MPGSENNRSKHYLDEVSVNLLKVERNVRDSGFGTCRMLKSRLDTVQQLALGREGMRKN